MDRHTYFNVFVGYKPLHNEKGELLGYMPFSVRKETRHSANQLWRRLGKAKASRPVCVKF